MQVAEWTSTGDGHADDTSVATVLRMNCVNSYYPQWLPSADSSATIACCCI